MPEEEKVTRKLRAILSADVKGYSILMSNDEAFTVKTLKQYRTVMSEQIEQHTGRVVDAPGDNLLAEFASVVDAVECAVEIQKILKDKNEDLPADKRLEFRIGVNIGDVIQDGNSLYGEGVNIAARIEGLAEPGGVCISRNAYDHIGNKLSIGYQYLGEHSVKNITKPVRVYKVLMDPEDAGKLIGDVPKPVAKNWIWATVVVAAVVIAVIGTLVYQNVSKPEFEPAKVEEMAYPLPDKPSIAVLPFDNMSDDPEQEFFSDGISEDIITSLSKTDELFVIARNSTFTYKGKPVNVKQVAEDLGVRYVLEGSVQKSEARVRITAQLIDAISGHHLWAERYDRDLKDIFALQDEITKKIVVSLGVTLQEGEQLRVWAERTKNLDYFLKFTKGIYHLNKYTLENARVAGRIGQELIEMEPQNPSGYDILGWYYLYLYYFGVSPKENGAIAYQMAKKSLSLDESNPMAHLVMSDVSMMMRLFDKAIAEAEQAIALSPNFAYAYQSLGRKLSYAGRPDEAIEKIHQAMRLDPFPSIFQYIALGRSYLLKHQYEKALVEYNKAYQQSPDSPLVLKDLASAYGLLGRKDEARDKADRVLEIDPDFSLHKFSRMSPFKNQSDTDLFVEGLRKAGIPETPRSSMPEKPSIAVLPFDNMSPDPDQEYFGDGISEDLITDLSKIPNLLVISRLSSFSYKGKSLKIQQIGKELDARYVLEGSVRKANGTVRINAQLIDAETGHHLWAERYDGNTKDIFDLQDKITQKIAASLAVELAQEERDRLTQRETKNMEAYEAYLKGATIAGSLRNDVDKFIAALPWFEKAIELDPDYSLAYAALAETYFFGSSFGIQRKLGLSMQQVRMRGINYLQKAMENPSNIAYRTASRVYTYRYQHEKAIDYGMKAIALAPNEYRSNAFMALNMISAGRPDEAILFAEKMRRADPACLW